MMTSGAGTCPYLCDLRTGDRLRARFRRHAKGRSMDDMTAKRKRPTDRLPSRLPNPPRSDEWLGGEAHVRFQRGRSWHDLFQSHRKGMAGLALAFLVGIAVGTGVSILTNHRR